MCSAGMQRRMRAPLHICSAAGGLRTCIVVCGCLRRIDLGCGRRPLAGLCRRPAPTPANEVTNLVAATRKHVMGRTMMGRSTSFVSFAGLLLSSSGLSRAVSCQAADNPGSMLTAERSAAAAKGGGALIMASEVQRLLAGVLAQDLLLCCRHVSHTWQK